MFDRWTAALRLALVAFTISLTGCASIYTDSNTTDVPVASFKKPAQVQPVQLLFEFQTKGAANARATEFLKSQVTEQVSASGLFSSVTTTPTPNGAILSITLNNVPLSDDAFTKGFVTGLTFGLAGSQVSDGYVCTATYSPGGTAPAVTKQARHAIHTVMGAHSAPANGVKAANLEAASRTMTRQIVSNVLNDLSQDGVLK